MGIEQEFRSFKKQQRRHRRMLRRARAKRKAETMMRGEVSTVPPAEGFVLCVQRQLTTDQVYPVGSIVSAEALGRNLQALLNAGYVAWRLVLNAKAAPQPRPLPAPAAPKARPKVQLVADRSPVEAWRLSLESMTRCCDGDRQLATDLLQSDKDGRALYLRASAEAMRAL